MCKAVRKKIITEIFEKYNLVPAKVDHGKKRKKPTKKELAEWKLRRAEGQEEWNKKHKLKRKKVISSKKRKFQKYKVKDTYPFQNDCSSVA